MKPFDYIQPRDLAEAASVWAAYGASARLLAGGTDMMVALRHGAVQTDMVIDLKRVAELGGAITMAGDRLRVPATATMTALRDYLAKHGFYPALQDAAAVVGSIQIRNRATLAGNICNASPAADTVPVLASLGASVEIHGPDGMRERAVADFIQGNRQIDLGSGEIVSAVLIPLPTGPHGCAFDRITRRRGVDLATTNMACSIAHDGAVTIAFGAVSPKPLVLRDETGTLGDPTSTPEDRAPVLRDLAAHASPITDVRANADYRSAMLCVMAERALGVAHARLAARGAHA
jgi:carbon-monoxide dehydrogenase medium subunit